MALTEFQRDLYRLLAAQRTPESGSYVAGGAALNEILHAPRLSRDVDLFHDTIEAVNATWQADKAVLQENGYVCDVLRESLGFIEAVASKNQNRVELQWLRDSAFRFFPLLPHPDLGLTLHPFDLATNKVLALVGRVEVRDWIDTLTCHQKVAPLGLLAWAACGKDEGWNPNLVLEEAARTAHYSRSEINELDWHDAPPDFIALKTQWRAALNDAPAFIETLPIDKLGQAVLDATGAIFAGDVAQLKAALMNQNVHFHAGRIGGAWPQIKTRD